MTAEQQRCLIACYNFWRAFTWYTLEDAMHDAGIRGITKLELVHDLFEQGWDYDELTKQLRWGSRPNKHFPAERF